MNLQDRRKTYIANPDDKNYFDNQKKVIGNNMQDVPNNYQPPYHDMYVPISGLFGKRLPIKQDVKDRYDPLGDFMYKKGLLDRNNVISYYNHYVNIDSSTRNKEPKMITKKSNWINIKSFSIFSTSLYGEKTINPKLNTNVIIIEIDINDIGDLKNNDKVAITGLRPSKKILKTIFTSNREIKELFEFENGSKYMKVNYSPYISLPKNTEKEYDTSELFITLSNIQGDKDDDNYIGNIPISTLNTIHRIYLHNPEKPQEEYNNSFFYIELVNEYRSNDVFTLKEYNVELEYHYILGIPLNYINAKYPTDIYHNNGYHIVNSVSENVNREDIINLIIIIDKFVAGTPEDFQNMNISINEILLSKIDEIELSFPLPNRYIWQLPRKLSQVVCVRMISSEFPNIQNNIIDSGSRKNNRLYWKFIEDGNTIYHIDIDKGNYTPSELKEEIIKKSRQIKRTHSRNVNIDLSRNKYLDDCIIDININTINNLTTIRGYSKVIIYKPFVNISPLPGNNLDLGLTDYTITIYQQLHRLNVGDTIIIENSLSYMGVPASVLNDEHQVHSIIDENNYTIQISNINFILPYEDNGGGNGVYITITDRLKLYFNYQDTMGKLLGFRDTGTDIAITNFSSVITNKDLYEMETEIRNINYRPVFYSQDTYINIVCKQFNTIDNIGNISRYFSKILLPNMIKNDGSKNTDKYVLNSFVNTPIYFHDPIRTLYELEFEFYTPDGELYDFDNTDHSFTLEIITITDEPKGSSISSYNGKVS